MRYEFIKAEKKGHVTTVTINRPEVMNSISPLVSVEMDHAFNDFDADPEQWICIITGAGEKAFSAGNDLKYQAVNGPDKIREIMKGVRGGFAGLTSRFDCYKPFIAAVNGLALGGGFESPCLRHHCRFRKRQFRIARTTRRINSRCRWRASFAQADTLSLGPVYDHDVQKNHGATDHAIWACRRSRSSSGIDSNCREDRRGNSPCRPSVHPCSQGSNCEKVERYLAGGHINSVSRAACHVSIRRFH